jgi:predicted RNA-binding protein YlqC (UPF0109 family)
MPSKKNAMKDLLEFLIKGLLGKEKFEIQETNDNNFTTFTVKAEPSLVGILIGRGGQTIKTIRNILKVRAILEKKGVNVAVTQKDSSSSQDQTVEPQQNPA